MISRPAAGALWILLSCVVSAAFEVFLSNVVQRLDPIALNTVCCGAIAFTHLAYELARDARGFLAKARAAWRGLILFNLSTAVAVWAMAVSFRWLEPSAAKALVSSVGPILTVAIGPWLIAGLATDTRKMIAVVGTALSAALLVWGRSPPGVVAALLAGLAVVLNTLSMKRFERAGWSISEMLAGRLLLVSFAGLLAWPTAGPGAPGVGDLSALLGVAVGWIWAPIFTFQWGLQKSDPVTAALIIAASPLLTLVFQAFDSRLVFTFVTVAAVSLNTAAAIFGQWPKVDRDTVFKLAKTGIK